MFSVHRFDAGLGREDGENSTILKEVIEKQRERAKRKYAAEIGEDFRTSKGETMEEKRARKAQAKLDKKERKSKSREDMIDGKTTDPDPTPSEAALTTKNLSSTSISTLKTSEIQVPVSIENHLPDSELVPLTVAKEVESLEAPHEEKLDSETDTIVFATPVTVEDSVYLWGVRSDIAENLISEGISTYFPVQSAVIPVLLRHSQKHPFVPPRDICVSAPTGSGKTLAYALPIVQLLDVEESPQSTATFNRFRRLRALVVLPSRELAAQVYRVFCRLCRKFASRIRVGLAHGGGERGPGGFSEEQGMLVSSQYDIPGRATPHSLVDILICTPGRLLEHLQATRGFTLQHLQFLVMDEADRLLGNAYDHWVRSLVSSTSVDSDASNFLRMRGDEDEDKGRQGENGAEEVSPRTRQRSGNGHRMFCSEQPRSLQRLLFSATLTDNPRKLALTGIRNPLVLRTSSLPTLNATAAPTSALPATLQENISICKTSKRPLVLLSLLAEACGSRLQSNVIRETSSVAGKEKPSYINCAAASDDIVLIFASSVESAHRLCRLLQIFNGQLTSRRDGEQGPLVLKGQVREITRLVRAEDRSTALQMARGSVWKDPDSSASTEWSRVKVLVASDQLARGIDLKNIRLVINYDPPTHARTYVHRVGRTARAQKIGHCITIVRQGQETEFKKLRTAVDNAESANRVMQERKLSPQLSIELKNNYTAAIAELGAVMDLEATGAMQAGEFIGHYD